MPRATRRGLSCLILILLFAARAWAAPVDFNRQVRPILAANCFACHGPDAGERQADLRLDTHEGALADLGGHAAVVPGQVEQSELIKRVATTNADEVMPPADSGKKLTPEKIDILKRWVAEGANWQEHWAYRKPNRPAPPMTAVAPPISNPPPIINPIDPFVRAKLGEHKLSAAPAADRVSLVRRLSLDLLGLPPTPQEVATFLADASPQAYENLVDRILASPHFGERMAMYWLDVVRYADTNGYHGDNHRDISLYRDYVIDAFNTNKPFDQFTREQLAGDLLPGATRATRIASGYNHLLMTTREGGAQPKEYTAKYAADRVRNISVAWLGATLGCAECHDHKFDPYSAKDFYSLAAFFADIQEVAVGVQQQVAMPDDAQTQRLAELDANLARLRTLLATSTPELAAAQSEWESTVSQSNNLWKPLVPSGAIAASGATLSISGEGTVLAGGVAPQTDVYTLVLPVKLARLSALRLEAIPHEQLPGRGPGRAANGNFVLSEIRVKLASAADPASGNSLKLVDASADFEQDKLPAAAAIDGKTKGGWAIVPHTGQPHVAVFNCQNAPAAEDGILTIELVQAHGAQHTLGHFRLSASDAPQPLKANQGPPPAILQVLAVAAGTRSPEQQKTLADYYRSIAPTLEPVRGELAAADKARTDFYNSLPTSLVSQAGEPRAMRVLPRGNWLSDEGELVNPAVPAFLAPLSVEGRRPSRLDLADWLTSADNPLVARVFVNRLWKLAFGQGIVKSADDFGSQGTAPTHPELLDWLACEFTTTGWDVKHLLKLIVMSETYRQASTTNPHLREVDPDNKWLARQSRFRLDAEMVRDTALAISGLLAPQIGGPSVKPYQPAGYWSHLNFPVREYEADHGASLYRRGLYTYWCRTYLHPSLSAFDAPTREECTIDRSRSNTPLQALVLLNDPIYVEAAREFARQIVSAADSDEARLQAAFRRALARDPQPAETQMLLDLLARHRAQFQADPKAAEQLLGVGEAKAPGDMDRAQLAAWTSVARVLLNLHETITRT